MNKMYTYIEENEDSQFSLQELKNISVGHITNGKTIKTWLQSYYKHTNVFSRKFGHIK